MRVKINDKWYDSAVEPITITFKELELNQIKAMEPKDDGSRRAYLSAPDTLDISEIMDIFDLAIEEDKRAEKDKK